jgi:hypothetical protein
MNINKMFSLFFKSKLVSFTIILSFFSTPAIAEVNSGDTAWILTSTALVLFMTLPGLALFYGGLVSSKNIVSVLMEHFALACVVSIISTSVGADVSLFEKSIREGESPVCHLQSCAYGALSTSRVPWDWSVNWVVNFT